MEMNASIVNKGVRSARATKSMGWERRTRGIPSNMRRTSTRLGASTYTEPRIESLVNAVSTRAAVLLKLF